MPKRYNTPHRSRVVKTRLSEDEYADFTARLAPYGISQSEFLRQAIRRATIRPIIHVSAVNDELLSAVGKLRRRTITPHPSPRQKRTAAPRRSRPKMPSLPQALLPRRKAPQAPPGSPRKTRPCIPLLSFLFFLLCHMQFFALF